MSLLGQLAAERVFIAFRLLVCLGQRGHSSAYAEVIMVFIAFRLLVCLGLILARLHSVATETVFIAFRLLVCLGPCKAIAIAYTLFLVFIAFRLLVCLGHEHCEGTHRAVGGLHCLSAFGLFGTSSLRTQQTATPNSSSLPFGFWSVWDSS